MLPRRKELKGFIQNKGRSGTHLSPRHRLEPQRGPFGQPEAFNTFKK